MMQREKITSFLLTWHNPPYVFKRLINNPVEHKASPTMQRRKSNIQWIYRLIVGQQKVENCKNNKT
jgi:hypothetical protein